MNTIPEGDAAAPQAPAASAAETKTENLPSGEADQALADAQAAQARERLLKALDEAEAKPAAVTPENTFGIAYAALKAALQQFVRLDVPAADPQRLKLENEFEAVRVAQEARTYPAPLLASAGEALQGALTFLNNHTEADRQTVQHLTGQVNVVAKRAALFTESK